MMQIIVIDIQLTWIKEEEDPYVFLWNKILSVHGEMLVGEDK